MDETGTEISDEVCRVQWLEKRAMASRGIIRVLFCFKLPDPVSYTQCVFRFGIFFDHRSEDREGLAGIIQKILIDVHDSLRKGEDIVPRNVGSLV